VPVFHALRFLVLLRWLVLEILLDECFFGFELAASTLLLQRLIRSSRIPQRSRWSKGLNDKLKDKIQAATTALGARKPGWTLPEPG
jgi:hypothetical protein